MHVYVNNEVERQRQRKQSQLHPGPARTQSTLLSRQALYRLSCQGNSAGRGSNLQRIHVTSFPVHFYLSLPPPLSYLVSRLPYFSWLMVMITLSAIAVQLAELQTRFGRPANILLNTTADANTTTTSAVPVDMEPVYFWITDFLFVLFTLVELTLKVCLYLHVQYINVEH